ncbi:MAG: sulfotransferase domain-containing protein [Phycisphaerales bacterium]|nr:sulfotransferase domain-containing protein [Phycisphaerales bacterium]
MTGRDHPTTIICCVHKGASTFVAGGFAQAVQRALPGIEHIPVHYRMVRGESIEALALPPTGVLATRVYPDQYDLLVEDPPPTAGRFADKKLIMLRRDPRDAAVSAYYSTAYSHPVPPDRPEQFLEERRRLIEIGPAKGVLRYKADKIIDEFLATVRFMRSYPRTLLTTYEELVSDFDAWFTRIADHLGWSMDVRSEISRGLAAQVQAPTAEDPSKHVRRVTPGNWRDVFDDALRTVFEERLGDDLLDAGYTW